MCELLDERDWNPWNRDVVDAELARVDVIVDQWTRVEQGFILETAEEVNAYLEQSRQQNAERHAELERARAVRLLRYDEVLCVKRLSWLEDQVSLEHYRDYRDTSLGRTLYPNIEDRISKLELKVARLYEQVGDAELVIDRNGWLPQERREQMYGEFRLWRRCLVEELLELIPQCVAAMKEASSRSEKAPMRNEVAKLTSKRDTLMAIPEPRAGEMCSECPRPYDWHRSTWNGTMWLLGAGPCPAWPDWSARMRETRRMVMEAVRRRDVSVKPVPQPLAVIPSGLALDEVIVRLEEIREKFPAAQVKRGSRNRWEVWPREGP